MTVTEVPPEGLSISAAAELSGLSVDTLRYYEKEGLTLLQAHRVHVLQQLDEVQTHLAAIDRKIDFYTSTTATLSAKGK